MAYLAGDIGGTKTVLSLYANEDQKMRSIVSKKYKSADYQNLEDIVKEFSDEHPTKIESACFGIAGPITNNICKATNLPWIIDAKKMERDLDIPKVFLINDLEANAYGIKTLDSSSFCSLNQGESNNHGNLALISAGTGLGEAGFFYNGKTTIPFACEGGHTDFAPQDDEEIDLLKYLKAKFGHVSYERILSGPGFYELYLFYTEKLKRPLSNKVENRSKDADPSVIISKEAVNKTCPTCCEVMKRFVKIYGAESGNLILKMGATGGLFIGGGIAPKILEALKKKEFMDSMTNKGRFEKLLKKVPVQVVLDEGTALKGAAYYCHHAFKG